MTGDLHPPSHYAECKALAMWMDSRQIVYCHVPNEAAIDGVVGRRIREQGGKRGVPDFLIFSVPPDWRAHQVTIKTYDHDLSSPIPPRGVAIEMKRRDAKDKPRKEQVWWLEALSDLGWVTRSCNGGAQATAFLIDLGFPSTTR